MNKIFNTARVFVTGIFLCGIFFMSGKASAAEAMDIFLETIEMTSKQNDRVFHQEITFCVPKFTGSLDFIGKIFDDTLKLHGNFEMSVTDADGQYEKLVTPFYFNAEKDNTALYFQIDKKWKKMTNSLKAVNATDIVATPNFKEMQEVFEKMLLPAIVKEVTVLQDNENSRTLLIKIDCKLIADLIKTEFEKDETIKNDELTESFFKFVHSVLSDSDVWYTWTVNKENWQTTTMSFNLSGIVQSLARNAINNPELKFLQTEPLINELLETLAFYSEFRGFTTFLDSKAEEKLVIPQKVLKAKEVQSFTDDDKSKKK